LSPERSTEFFSKEVAMKRSLLAVSAALVLALGLSGPASAADPHASCGGLAASSFAGQPGGHAADLSDAFAEAAERGITVGGVISEFSQNHLGSLEACWGN
jgi:hypothetical protein